MEFSSPKENILKSSHLLPPVQDSSFSACLLIKDDNDKLREWLAYHYTAASLKNLIVAEDPTSTTSALPILELWNRTTDMEIFLWNDTNYMPEGGKLQEKMNKISTRTVGSFKFNDQESREMIKLHMVRQKEFISKCLLFHQKKERKWTMLIDTDEYLVFNKLDKAGNERQYEEVKRIGKHREEVLERVKTLRSDLSEVGRESIAHYAERYKFELPWIVEPCMPLPRLFFGSIESSEAAVKESVPHIFDAKKFDTLRYRKHAKKGEWENNLYDKSIVDLSRITQKALHNIVDPHRPIVTCLKNRDGYNPTKGKISRIDQTLLRVHHYVGSWESFDAKKITRRSREKYDEKGRVDFGTDDDIRPWAANFVDLVGVKKAQNLLRNKLV
eukprot:CAMPEP_0194292748 /NCGR_PEP_ID=MMETSP0169-20130528/46380_1 /TAXON_ID=218684 /ORGANISM="Corethron pennatum, Strain L29A3" /LENGTH=385 /DNA_ID=CAMNT_0039041041 /DNA_START=556 /DNA_END=1713 /DNA_ORIENTATION=-